MRTDNAIGDEAGDSGGVVVAVFDIVQRFTADLQPLGTARIPLGHARVQVPAVVVELAGIRDGADFGQRFVFELTKAYDDVGNLNAGVIDVVLDLHLASEEPQ